MIAQGWVSRTCRLHTAESWYQCNHDCADAKIALARECLKPLQQLPAASDFLDFLLRQDGRRIPVSLEAFDEVCGSLRHVHACSSISLLCLHSKTKFDAARLIIYYFATVAPSGLLNALQADLPEILIAESSGGLSHISSLVEAIPFHGGEEHTTAMMSAFIPVAMQSLLKVCLCCGLYCTAFSTLQLLPLCSCCRLKLVALMIIAYDCGEALDMHDCILGHCRAACLHVQSSSHHCSIKLQAWLMLQNVSLPGSEHYLRFDYSGNKTEKRSSNPSSVLSQRLDRPDMLLTSSGATVLVGEDKVSVAI